jgi:hypothetical protein
METTTKKGGTRWLSFGKWNRKLLWDKIYVVVMIIYSIIMISLAIAGIGTVLSFKKSEDYNLGTGTPKNHN